MQSYDSFTFDAVTFDEQTGKIELAYGLDDEVKFTETLTLPFPADSRFNLQPPTFNRALFALHLIGGISYYKTCLPKKMEIKSGSLNEDQAAFWNSVYENGLGELFYKNKVDFGGLIHFPVSLIFQTPSSKKKPKTINQKPKTLVPIGGGKDSLVTIELLRAAGYDITLLRMEDHPIITELASAANLPMLTIKRSLDPQLFDLNKQGALNGHIPITAYLSFAAIIVAMLHGFDAVVMSNERSANDGNVEYLGSTINHQWSKGLQYERMMQEYLQHSIGTNIQYFSLLRPLSELHISRMFSRFPQYFSLATSCNANWKILTNRPSRVENPLPLNRENVDTRKNVETKGADFLSAAGNQNLWCGHCPKCAFVFAMLAAFLPKDQLIGMFGKNLFDDDALIPLYKQLLGIEGFKPFECVGTPEETLCAFILAHEHDESFQRSLAMTMALAEATLPDDVNALIAAQFTPSTDHAIPAAFQSILFKP